MGAVAIEIKQDELAKSRDMKNFYRRLSEEYEGSWVAILKTGDLIVNKDIEAVYSEAQTKSAGIVALFPAAKKGQLIFR